MAGVMDKFICGFITQVKNCELTNTFESRFCIILTEIYVLKTGI